MATTQRPVVTYGRHRQRVVSVDPWSSGDSSKHIFSSFSSNDSVHNEEPETQAKNDCIAFSTRKKTREKNEKLWAAKTKQLHNDSVAFDEDSFDQLISDKKSFKSYGRKNKTSNKENKRIFSVKKSTRKAAQTKLDESDCSFALGPKDPLTDTLNTTDKTSAVPSSMKTRRTTRKTGKPPVIKRTPGASKKVTRSCKANSSKSVDKSLSYNSLNFSEFEKYSLIMESSPDVQPGLNVSPAIVSGSSTGKKSAAPSGAYTSTPHHPRLPSAQSQHGVESPALEHIPHIICEEDDENDTPGQSLAEKSRSKLDVIPMGNMSSIMQSPSFHVENSNAAQLDKRGGRLVSPPIVSKSGGTYLVTPCTKAANNSRHVTGRRGAAVLRVMGESRTPEECVTECRVLLERLSLSGSGESRSDQKRDAKTGVSSDSSYHSAFDASESLFETYHSLDPSCVPAAAVPSAASPAEEDLSDIEEDGEEEEEEDASCSDAASEDDDDDDYSLGTVTEDEEEDDSSLGSVTEDDDEDEKDEEEDNLELENDESEDSKNVRYMLNDEDAESTQSDSEPSGIQNTETAGEDDASRNQDKSEMGSDLECGENERESRSDCCTEDGVCDAECDGDSVSESEGKDVECSGDVTQDADNSGKRGEEKMVTGDVPQEGESSDDEMQVFREKLTAKEVADLEKHLDVPAAFDKRKFGRQSRKLSSRKSHHGRKTIEFADAAAIAAAAGGTAVTMTTPVRQKKSRMDILREESTNRLSFEESLTPIKCRAANGKVLSGREKVLLHCGQDAPQPFSACLTPAMLKKCVKIGEGVYGEVFRTERGQHQAVALKIIPIEGDFNVNDEPQKTFGEMLSEIVISKELSDLRYCEENWTDNFVHVKNVSVVQGCYPPLLLKQWDLYHKRKVSENDRPDVFSDQQLFIVFEFEECGCDLEAFEFSSLEQAKSVLAQVACSLAVAESALEFEHRDLHWGNVLVKRTTEEALEYSLQGVSFQVETSGVRAAVIDFTLSRLCKDHCSVFCDLSTDPTLFEGEGDYQFEVYRLMKEENGNKWGAFHPYTNVLWLHYLADKLLKMKTYPNPRTKQHQTLLRQFRTFLREALDYQSAAHLIMECSFFH